MYSTPEEVEETVRMIGAADASVIATFITPDPGLNIARVKQQVAALAEKCRQRNVLFDYRPKVHPQLMDNYYTPGAKLEGRCLYPFLHARVGFSGKVYFCPFIRVEVGDLATSSLEEIWNGPTYVEMRRRLLEHGIFPVCRRCCKVELSPEPVADPFPAGRRSAARHSSDGRSLMAADLLGRRHAPHQSAAHQRRGVHASGPLPGARGRARHDQAALYARADGGAAAPGRMRGPADRRDRRASVDRRRHRTPGSRRLSAIADCLSEHDADPRRRRRGDGHAEAPFRRADVLLRPACVDDARRRRCSARPKSTACSSASRRTR